MTFGGRFAGAVILPAPGCRTGVWHRSGSRVRLRILATLYKGAGGIVQRIAVVWILRRFLPVCTSRVSQSAICVSGNLIWAGVLGFLLLPSFRVAHWAILLEGASPSHQDGLFGFSQASLPRLLWVRIASHLCSCVWRGRHLPMALLYVSGSCRPHPGLCFQMRPHCGVHQLALRALAVGFTRSVRVLLLAFCQQHVAFPSYLSQFACVCLHLHSIEAYQRLAMAVP